MVVKSLKNFLGAPHHHKKLMAHLCTMNTKNEIEKTIEKHVVQIWKNLTKTWKSSPNSLNHKFWIFGIFFFITNFFLKGIFLDKFIKLLQPQKLGKKLEKFFFNYKFRKKKWKQIE